MYGYVANDPVNLVDSFGLITQGRIPGLGLFSLSAECQSFKDWHYKRNGYNRDVDYETTKETWDSSVDPRYHQQGCRNEGNIKFVSPDGRSETIFNSNHIPLNDPLNRGTYNYADPLTDPIGHFFKDMIPYYLLGNSPDDPSKNI